MEIKPSRITEALRLLILLMLLMLSEISYAKDHSLLLEGLDGKHHALSEYVGKGKWVVVNVWATACPHCRRELFDLASFYEKHRDKDAIVIGLTLDLETFELPDKKHVAIFAATYLLDYPLLLVSGQLASKVIGRAVNTVPTTFFYNPVGRLVYEFNGELTIEILEDIINNKKPNTPQKSTKQYQSLTQ
jgi:thiol-disulfide isomerase/thioredoxin